MAELRKCPTCGALTKEAGHLCTPVPTPEATCSYCGEGADSARHVCQAKREQLQFVCDACGRMADSADLLCQPAKIPGC